MTKANLATVWLDGCSGCHMSFLDMDGRLLNITGRANLVYSPLVDVKEFPPNVDVTLVEGAVSSEDDPEKIKIVRSCTRILVSLGDCAVTSKCPRHAQPLWRRAPPAACLYRECDRQRPAAIISFDPQVTEPIASSA
jgi:NAD-reducing hydrogenase small subunit